MKVTTQPIMCLHINPSSTFSCFAQSNFMSSSAISINLLFEGLNIARLTHPESLFYWCPTGQFMSRYRCINISGFVSKTSIMHCCPANGLSPSFALMSAICISLPQCDCVWNQTALLPQLPFSPPMDKWQVLNGNKIWQHIHIQISAVCCQR